MWRHIAHSTRGDAHSAEDALCQDSSRVVVLGDGPEETLVACIADGAGSAKYGRIGSLAACESIIHSASNHFELHRSLADLQLDDVVHWCEEARAKLFSEAATLGTEVRELATTLCAAIVSPVRSCFFQIGDGAIIPKRLGIYGVAFWPQSGEYANTTNFLTSHEYLDHLQFVSTPNGCSDIALLTDGMERLALRFDIRTPHPPFFEPLFRALRNDGTSGEMAEGLCKFLQSQTVRSRSDDDKTLVLASRICGEHIHAD